MASTDLCFAVFFCFLFLTLGKWIFAKEVKENTYRNHGTDATPMSTINKGVYLNPIHNVMIYESSVPLSFVIHLPALKPVSKDPLKICIPDISSLRSMLCQIFHSAHSTSKVVVDQLLQSHPYLKVGVENVSSKSKRGLINIVGEIDKFLFGMATTRDVNRLQVSEDFIETRQNQIIAAVQQEHKSILSLFNTTHEYTVQLKKVVEDDMTEIMKYLHEESLRNKRVEDVIGLAVNELMYQQYISFTSSVLDAAVSDCRNKLIPRSLLSDNKLQEKITHVSNNLETHGYVLATDVTSLHKLEVADCWFADNRVQITVHLPMKQTEHEFEIFEIIPVLYQFKEYQCQVHAPPKYIVKKGSSIIPVSDHIERYCHPKDKRMCYIPIADRYHSPFSSCGMSIFEGNADEINKECVFQCTPSEVVRVKELSLGKIAVTNAKTVEFFCDDERMMKKYNVANGVGALLLKIPCFCHAVINQNMVNGNIVVNPPYPCPSNNTNDGSVITHVIPTHMTQLKGLLIDDSPSYYTNFSNIVDLNWLKRIPIINVTQALPFHLTPSYKTEQLELSLSASNTWIFIWNTVLTVGLLLVMIFPYFNRNGRIFMPVATINLRTPNSLSEREETL